MKSLKLLAAALVLSTLAASAATNPDATNSFITAATNANPTEAMTALFGDPVIAKGDGFTVKRSELDEVLTGARANAAAQGQQLPPGTEVQVLDQLVTIQILLQKATDADRVEGQKTADEQYATILKRIGSQEALDRQLKSVGMTVEMLKQKATQEATAKATLRRLLGVFVTDAEVRQYFTNHPADFEEPESAHVQHILLLTINTNNTPPTPLDTNTIAAKRAQIDGLLKRVRAGEDFGTVARESSEDLSTRDSGGDLPKFAKGRMGPEFEAAAFSLNTNQISDVVSTAYGFHIIKLLEKFPAKLVDFTTVASDIKDFLTRQKMAQQAQPLVEKLKSECHMEIVDPNLKALAALVASATNNPVAEPAH